MHDREDASEARRDADAKCRAAELNNFTFSLAHYGLTNNDLFFTGYPLHCYWLSEQNAGITASGTCAFGPEDPLLTACPWDPRIKATFLHRTAVSIPLDRVKEYILDVQKLRNLNPKAFCGFDIYNGILMRYVEASSAYLGKPSDMLDFDTTYYRNYNPNTPRLNEDFIEEFEQMALFKYNGLPHGGKNLNLAFNGVIRKYANSQYFLKVKEQYDPDGLFSSEWSDQILGLAGSVIVLKERCALEGLWVCSEDLRCAPDKGYFCRSGKIYI